MTRDEATTAAGEIYNEETGDYISSTYLVARANEAKSRIERKTLCYPVSSTFDLTDSVRTYILPAGMFAIRSDGVSVSTGILIPRTLSQIMAAGPLTWDVTESTRPNFFYPAESMITTDSVVNWGIGVAPIPSATVSSGITVMGWGISADFADGDAKVPWPTPFHMTLVWELCVMAATRDMDYQLRNERPLRHFQYELKKAEDDLRSAFSGLIGKTLQIGEGAPGEPDAETLMVVTIT